MSLERTTPLPLTSLQNWRPYGNRPTTGAFVNDHHEPSTRIREDPTQTCSNTNLALGGSDPPTCPNPNRALEGSDLGTSMATSPGDIILMSLDLAD